MNKKTYEVARYTQITKDGIPCMTESSDGNWVKRSDFEELEAQVKQLAAENAVKQEFISTCFRAAGDGGDMDGSDIQELGARLGLFERQTYQPALHGYICGHEAGEDSVYVMKASPATDAILASLRAEGVEMAVEELITLAERSKSEAPIASEHTHAAALYIKLIATQLLRAEGVEWIEGNTPEQFGRYWVRYETDVGPKYCSAQWIEHNFCASSKNNIHKIWLADHSRSINSLKGVTHYTRLPEPIEGGAK